LIPSLLIYLIVFIQASDYFKMRISTISFSALIALLNYSVASGETPCLGNCSGEGDSKECTFTFSVNLYASELGYFTVEECGSQVMPVLGVEKGVTYKFIQHNVTNYMHPLGFAYFPDGAHAELDELEPGIVPPGSSSTCAEDLSCPAPMYMLNGAPIGEYSNNPITGNVTTSLADFGLDAYEPDFFLRFTDWVAKGAFEIMLYFDVDDFEGDIFYFCHVHQFMSGRIKFVDSSGNLIKTEDSPEIPYSYEVPSTYDAMCGTFNVTDFQLPNAQCTKEFVCNVPSDNPGLAQYSDCMASLDCAMMAGMTTNVASESEVALFIHQMIPHHQNAVNMAKALLKTGKLDCPDVTVESDDCKMMVLMHSIIAGQNHEIQLMRNVLKSQGFLLYDDCHVPVTEMEMPTVEKKAMEPNSLGIQTSCTNFVPVILALTLGLFL